MRKNLLILLFLFPLLSSCAGFPISREDALNVLKNIENNVQNVISTSYTIKSISKSGDAQVETAYFYSKENRYFHNYTIDTKQTKQVYENWNFKKTYIYEDQTTEDFIFTVSREPSPLMIDDLEKQYVVTYEKFTDESWQKYASEFEASLSRRYEDVIEHSREIIGNKSNSVNLKSFNGNSLFLEFNETLVGSESQNSGYQIYFNNNHLNSIKTISGQTEIETTFKYSSIDVVYPSFKIIISKP